MRFKLNPGTVDDSALPARPTGINPGSKSGLQQYVLMHMIYSRRQLREMMTWFWDNHFNTDINTRRMSAGGGDLSVTPAYELAENQAFRANALGNFRDLLHISAKSPAMLIYLDSSSNVDLDSNENYARESMELHTVGVDGGYIDHDVAAAAELFTGWGVSNGQFVFNPSLHNFDGQTVMGLDIASGGGEPGGRMSRRLGEFADGIGALYRDLGSLINQVVILTMTEFGRTSKQNGSLGTDHGVASSWFAAGGGIAGGIYGAWPGLAIDQLVNGRFLDYTVDHRDIMGDILTAHLGGANLGTVLPGHNYSPLGLYPGR